MWSLKVVVVFILGLYFISEINAHPTHYPNVKKPKPKNVEPYFYSYHIHILFLQHNNDSVAKALELRQEYISAFQPKPHCKDLFHNDYMCMFEVEYDPAGPFVIGQWAVYLLPEHFDKSVKWIMQRRGNFDTLVHPNSGYELEDHTDWALWGGRMWPIDPTAFHGDNNTQIYHN